MLQGNAGVGDRARRLRKSMSLPEGLLWKILKQKPLGLKFRRQHPAGPYVVDFYCHEARAIIEIDGISHDMGDQAFRDETRDRYFIEKGLQVFRIAASDVLNDPEAIADSIVTACCATSPSGGDSFGVTH